MNMKWRFDLLVKVLSSVSAVALVSLTLAVADQRVPQKRALKSRIAELMAAFSMPPVDRKTAYRSLDPPAQRECDDEFPMPEAPEVSPITLLSWKIRTIRYFSEFTVNQSEEACPGHSYTIESMAHTVIAMTVADKEPYDDEIGVVWAMVDGVWYLYEFDC